ncbi:MULTISPECIES: NB-ARC domain-containing protein [unclassified Coleofasciculus]|uniref:NB-ARC domain-containing protein n=1 Tax=unclassified Coleofasciculus TaxID=2692782 RepID=UPI001881AB47|nr:MULTISPECIES: NB-ARC domain-containing protein [unclassified Coleofasciculus]MBE9125756.1 NACHT domain-containing protein [Coleofasciculus sp. LEGE 07081]MBE9147244.1 NACHT domain-containing protein [Coleofasciculus sp. LEGE 07092]
MISQDFLNAIATEHGLSKGELEVLSLAMEGQSTAAIANRLGISGDAVRKRLSEVYQKFQIAGRGPVKLTKLQQLLVNRYQTYRETPNTESERRGESQVSNPKTQNRIDWGEAPDVSVFYGRTDELATLKRWIVKERCRLVALLGMSGMGKTALSVKLAKQLQGEFEFVIWRSLRQAPSVQDLLASLIQFLSEQSETVLPKTVNNRVSLLIDFFREHRCLVILDSAESILRTGELAGVYQEGYEGYGDLFKRLGQEPHKSCLLLTSQEKVGEISLLEGETSPVRSLKLGGLGDAAQAILKEKGLSGEKNWGHLIQGYRGNPLMLKLIAITIKEVFDGNVTDFLSTTLFTSDISDFIEDILDRLSDLEEKILFYIASQKEPVVFGKLQKSFSEVSPQYLMGALGSLRQRSLVEKSEGGFILPPAVTEVVAQLVSDLEG